MATTTPRTSPNTKHRRRAGARRTLDPRSCLDEADRRLRRAVLASALQGGESLHPDAATVAIAAKRWRPEPFEYFDEDTVAEMLWVDMLAWCEAMGTQIPLDAGTALWHLLVVLDATSGLAPPAAPLTELLATLETQGGLARPTTRSRRSQR